MKKRIHRINCTLPVLGDDELPFGAAEEKVAKLSFTDAFDSSLFDKDAEIFFKQKRKKNPFVKQKLSSCEQLDLHGFTSTEAELRVVDFLKSITSRGVKTVRIITGKGLHSPTGPVLPDVVEGVLRVMLAQKKIKGFSWEKRIKEESGAVIVSL